MSDYVSDSCNNSALILSLIPLLILAPTLLLMLLLFLTLIPSLILLLFLILL